MGKAPFGTLWLGLLACLSGSASLSGQDPGFQPLLWVHQQDREQPGFLKTVRQLGFLGLNLGGGDDPGVVAGSGLKSFVDPALPKGILALRESTFARLLSQARGSHSVLERPVDLAAPATRERARRALQKRLGPFRKHPPLFVSLGDEISFTYLIHPIDWFKNRGYQERFAAFLRARPYLREALRQTTGRTAALQPMGTGAARRRFLTLGRSPAALVPWNATRAYADDQFQSFVHFAAREVRQILPGTPVGFLGGQMPSAFGGFDWERLLPGLQMVEAYPPGATPKLVASLGGERVARYRTLFVGHHPTWALLTALQRSFLTGERGVIFYSSNELKEWLDAQPDRGRQLKKALALLTGKRLAPFRQALPLKPQVAILHSMPSVRLHWMLDAAHDGEAWVHRSTSYEVRHATQARTRSAWVSMLEDMGLRCAFITPSLLTGGILEKMPFGALVLPRTLALSQAAAQTIERFVKHGGLLLADAQTALFDAQLRERSRGLLDGLFGIRHHHLAMDLHEDGIRFPSPKPLSYPVAEPGLRSAGAWSWRHAGPTPLLLHRTHGLGQSLYLNLLVASYACDRFRHPRRAASLRNQLRPLFLEAGVRPFLRLPKREPPLPWPVGIHLRRGAKGYLLGVAPNLFGAGTPLPFELLGKPATAELLISLPGGFWVRDLVRGQELGRRRQLHLTLSLGQIAVFSLSLRNS